MFHYNKIKNNSAAVLLFALITAFVLSLIGGTFVLLTSNQWRFVNSEGERTMAFYRAQAGVEYAIWWAREHPDLLPSAGDGALNITVPAALNNVTINIFNIDDPSLPGAFQDLGDYGIQVSCNYQS